MPFNRKWAAAVYTAGIDLTGVKSVDVTSVSSGYNNSDHAGTPEFSKAFVTGGARGGGGSNWTGSYGGTATAQCVAF